MSDSPNRYRRLREEGLSRDVALGVLRREGASFLLSIKALREVDGLPFGEFKRLVHESLAWADSKGDREEFWDAVIAAIQELPEAQ